MSNKTPIVVTRVETAISGTDVLDIIQTGDTVTLQGPKRKFTGTAFERAPGSWTIRNGLKLSSALPDREIDGVAFPTNVVSIEKVEAE